MSDLPKDDIGLASVVSVVDVFLGSIMLMLAVLSVLALAIVIREAFNEIVGENFHNRFHRFLEKAHLVHAR